MDQNAKGPKGAGFLKVCGILMIIGGAVGIILGIVALVGVIALSALAETSMGGLIFSAVLALVAGILQLIAGIIGVKNCKNPAKATTCIVWGAIVAILSIVSQILTVSGGGKFDFVSCLTGLVVPVLFIIGAVLNKKG